MAHYADLDRLDYFGAAFADRLLAVDWIESPDQCRGGDVDGAFFDALVALLVDPWQPFAVAGWHRCRLCRFTGGPATLHHGSMTVSLGANNLFVCGEDRVYVAPSTIVHYVDSHGYCPPDDFQRAVRTSPPMRSMDYLRSVRRHGLHRLASPSAG